MNNNLIKERKIAHFLEFYINEYTSMNNNLSLTEKEKHNVVECLHNNNELWECIDNLIYDAIILNIKKEEDYEV